MTDSVSWERLQDLFHRALEREPDERGSFLDQACGTDVELRRRVDLLLSASDRAGEFLRDPAVSAVEPAPGDESAQAGRRIGAYRLVRLLGRGGMGAVYLAERCDGSFEQRVAIKLIKRGMDTEQVLSRFRAERQILALLDHPNIARLLDGGTTDDGLPFFAMEYIDGQPIDAYADGSGLDVEARLGLFLQVCDAVGYANERGVIHRDIKPLNTLVTPAGAPKLLDFGIAKLLQQGSDETATVTGLRLLTPDYASPEQIEGRRATVASDVYSLGVVLFELLTGRSPYRVSDHSPSEIAAAVRTADPERPSRVVPRGDSGRLRGDLDAIVLTALRKDPARRYSSAAALADDIRRHLTGRPIAARGETGYRVGRLIRRRPAMTALAAIALAGSAATGILLTRGGAPSETLISTRAMAPRDRIMVADLVDRAGDDLLAAAITDAVRTDLSQSAIVRVMTPRQVRSALALMQQSPDVALSDSLARELAVRAGVKAIVTGSLGSISGGYTISLELVAAHDGEVLTAVRESARDSTGLIAAVDRASRVLRQRIGEPLRDLADVSSLRQVTTPSLAALRLFSEAQRLVYQGDRRTAIERFEQAVGLDSGFASAHLALSMAYASVADHGRAELESDRALANRDRLPFRERGFLVASRAHLREDYETAIQAYSDVIARYPEDVAALNNLAMVYRDARRFAVAESLFVRADQIDSTIANFLFGRHGAQILQGKFAAATATLDTLNRRFPGHPVYLTELMQDAAARQDWPRAEQTAWTMIETIGTDSFNLVDPYEALAQIAMTRGRLGEAERLWATHAAVSSAAGVMGRHLFGVIQRGHLLLRYRGDTARAVALVDSVLQVRPLESLLRNDRRYDELIRFYLAAGERGPIDRLLTEAAATDRAMGRPGTQGDRLWTLGMVALADGRVAAAVDTLRLAAGRLRCPSCVLPDLGSAYEQAGRFEDAADAYRRYQTTPWLWRYEPDATELGTSLRRLVAVSHRLGDTAGARAAREKLLDLWKLADRPLRAVAQAAGPAPDATTLDGRHRD